jgi:hypothetical protein
MGFICECWNQRAVKAMDAHTHSKIRRKRLNKRCVPTRTLMTTVIWGKKGVLMVEYMQHGTAISSEVCCETLKELCRDIQNKRCGMLTHGVVLLHDNARPNTAAHTRALVEHFNWELFDHLS